MLSDIPVNLETVDHAGYMFCAGNVRDLEKKLSHLVKKPNEVVGMRRIAQTRAKTEFDWDTVGEST